MTCTFSWVLFNVWTAGFHFQINNVFSCIVRSNDFWYLCVINHAASPLKSTSPLPSVSNISMTLCTSGFCCNSGKDMNSSTLRDPELSRSSFLNLFPSLLISSASTRVDREGRGENGRETKQTNKWTMLADNPTCAWIFYRAVCAGNPSNRATICALAKTLQCAKQYNAIKNSEKQINRTHSHPMAGFLAVAGITLVIPQRGFPIALYLWAIRIHDSV